MLTLEESTQIVVECIQAVSGVDDVDTTGTLSDARIIDTPRLNNFLTLVINSSDIGVPSKNYRINQGWFNNVSTETIVDDVIDIVEDRSVKVQENPADDFASMVADHIHLQSEFSRMKMNERSLRKEKAALAGKRRKSQDEK